ncbi:MAG: FG-GAP repeat protein [Phycisphaerales bacterium]
MSLRYTNKRSGARFVVTVITFLCSRSGLAQCELDKLLPDDAAPSQTFGVSVAIAGDLVIAGSIPLNQQAAGAAYIFMRTGSNWNQEARLTSEDGAPHDEFGVAVDICGDYAVVGARLDDDNGPSSGSAYVFHRVGTNWFEMPKLTASDASSNDQFGVSVAISCTPDGDRIVVGARNSSDFGTSSGSAYVFRREGDLWVEEAKLLASDGTAWDLFAFSVAMDDQRIAIGARGLLGAGDGLGAVYLYTRRDTTWTEETKLSASDEQPGDFFGYSVAVNGGLIGIGATSVDDDGPSSGAAYIFRLTETGWQEEQKLYSSDISQADGMGFSVGIAGDTALVGAWFGDSDRVEDSGMVYRFEHQGDSWVETARIAASDAGDGDQFGRAMDFSGDLIVVGAPFDDDAGASSGGAYVFGVTGDCNENGLLDICEIADNPKLDMNDNAILDECESPECPWDLDENGVVGASDLLSLLVQWGTDPGGPPDFDDDGNVGASDLLALLVNWGRCP